MKRFYCTVCKSIKRVRKLPSNIKSQHSDTVTNRVGICNRHTDSSRSISQLSGSDFLHKTMGVTTTESHPRPFASMAEKRRYNAIKGIK
jgi:hypothetical protein